MSGVKWEGVVSAVVSVVVVLVVVSAKHIRSSVGLEGIRGVGAGRDCFHKMKITREVKRCCGSSTTDSEMRGGGELQFTSKPFCSQ